MTKVIQVYTKQHLKTWRVDHSQNPTLRSLFPWALGTELSQMVISAFSIAWVIANGRSTHDLQLALKRQRGFIVKEVQVRMQSPVDDVLIHAVLTLMLVDASSHPSQKPFLRLDCLT